MKNLITCVFMFWVISLLSQNKEVLYGLEETPQGISQSVRQSAPGARGVLKRIQQRVFTARGYYTPKAQTLFDDSKNAQKAAIQEASNITLRIKKSLDNIGAASAIAATKTGTKESLETLSLIHI